MANTEILIIDDDPMVGELSRDLLAEEGYKVTLLQNSMESMEVIKQTHPRLIITDIMMPGITGLDICKAVKSDPELKHIKIIVVSGKAYDIEKQRSLQFGADFFLQKPYKVDVFSKTVKSIFNGVPLQVSDGGISLKEEPAPESSPAQTSDLAAAQLRLTVWGGRGLAGEIPNTASRFGRQTSCVSVESRDHLFIFDAGTGIVALGREIAARKRYYKNIWICLTHFHLDHVLGLGNFQPVDDPAFAIHLIGPNDPEKSLKAVAQETFYSSFSLTKRPPKAKINIYEILEDNYELMPGVKLFSMYANHPTSSLVYKIEMFGKKIVYAPDSEILGDATAFQDYDEKLAGFAGDADVFIHDAAYCDADYEQKKHEGHSGVGITVEFAGEKTKATDLILFHANPEYTDQTLEAMLDSARTKARKDGYTINCHLAEEGKTILLQGRQ